MIGQMISAFGADDVAGNRPKFRKLRFQMIADKLQRSLRGKRAVRKADGSVARHRSAGWQLRAGAGRSADVNSAHDADEPEKPTCLPHNPAPPILFRRGL